MRTCKADVVGSMLRPDYLLDARDEHKLGRLSDEGLREAEDRAIDDAIAIQERTGVDVVTDGELRRNVFACQLVQASEGFDAITDNWIDWFDTEGESETRQVSVGLVSRIEMKRHLSAGELTYLKSRSDRPTKVAIPSPTMYAYYWMPGISDAAYPSPDAYLAHVTDILTEEVDELVRLGCDYVQIDAPEFGMLIDHHQREWFARKGFDPDRLLADGVDMVNAMISGHSDVTFGLHVCKGNEESHHMARGGYDRIAGVVFPRTDAGRLLLEYDDERSGGFEPLAHVPDDKVVVLGLLTTKSERSESNEEVLARIAEAAEYVPLERLALSTQCGFASVARGNAISMATQEKKLRQVAMIARQVWGE